jgi:hypothetical protein
MVQQDLSGFRADLFAMPLADVVHKWLFQGNTFVFRERPILLDVLKSHLSKQLKVRPQEVGVVGSAKTGFSLDPNAFPRPFHDGSDIDVIVVSSELFDRVWHTILSWHYPRRGRVLPPEDSTWLRVRASELYWGWLVPSEIGFERLTRSHMLTPLRELANDWFAAFKGCAAITDFAARDVEGRLYRSWDHALQYHVNGLKILYDKLQPM